MLSKQDLYITDLENQNLNLKVKKNETQTNLNSLTT